MQLLNDFAKSLPDISADYLAEHENDMYQQRCRGQDNVD